MTPGITLDRITIATETGPMPMLVSHPRDGQCRGGIVVVQHIGGLSATMESEARRIAELGYCCVVPALYHRLGDIVIDPTSTDENIAAIRDICVRSLRPRQVGADLETALDWLDTSAPRLPRGPRALVGYGGGAGLALEAGTDLGPRIAAIASILGVGFLDRKTLKPLFDFGRITAELYFAFAGDDDIIPAAMVDALDAHLRAADRTYDIAIHPGQSHGYAFPERPNHSPDASGEDWLRIDRMLQRHLG